MSRKVHTLLFGSLLTGAFAFACSDDTMTGGGAGAGNAGAAGSGHAGAGNVGGAHSAGAAGARAGGAGGMNAAGGSVAAGASAGGASAGGAQAAGASSGGASAGSGGRSGSGAGGLSAGSGGANTAGANTAGANTAGANTAGANTAGANTAGGGGSTAGSGGASAGSGGAAGPTAASLWDFEAAADPFRYEGASQYDNFNQSIGDQAVQVTTGPKHHGAGSMELTIKPANIGVLNNTDCKQPGVGTCSQTDCPTDCSTTELMELRLGETDKSNSAAAGILPGDTITFWIYLPSGATPVKITKAEVFINSGDPYWTSTWSAEPTTSVPTDTWVAVSAIVPDWGSDCSTGGTPCLPPNRVALNLWFDQSSGPGPFYVDDVTRTPAN